MNLPCDTMKNKWFYAAIYAPVDTTSKLKHLYNENTYFLVPIVVLEGRTSSPVRDINLNALQPQVPMTDPAL